MSAEAVSGAVLVGRVFLVRAFKTENAGDLSRVIRQVTSARREAGRPILCFMIVDPEAELPTDAGREAMQRTTLSLLNYCESVTLIIEGNELRQTLLRTVLRGMATTLGGQPTRVRVVEQLQAAARLAGETELMLAQLIRLGREAGVWSSGASKENRS